ncbi:acetyl-CoA C-acetyltransferase [Cupriavidus sp. 2TAF22]|uniref:acetyl-CoA C-acetyltransferase n=1 Tax=unclassified Cupriavidus TaxID=2640874 RepID=UPI003F8D9CB4
MSHAYIVSPLRTPVGKFGGALAPLSAADLAAHVLRAVLQRSGAPEDSIDEVIVAQSYQSSEAPCIGRYAASLAGLPESVSGYAVDRRCGSGLQAVINAAMQVQSGVSGAVLVAGVESMSNIEYYSTSMRWGARMGDAAIHDRLDRGRVNSQPVSRYGVMAGGAAETAENLARDYGIARAESDRYAARSHQLATEAWNAGRFEEEVVPVPVPQRKGAPILFRRDEGIREDASLELMAKLPALLRDGTVTAGNACQQSDAASACLVVSEDYLKAHRLEPMGRLVGWAGAGCDPLRMGIGPVPAVARLLPRIGMTLSDLDLIEVNEAFAVQVLSVLRAWGIKDVEADGRINVNGSGISLGHPIGATGVRILATMLHEMRRRGARYGLETMCIGGGQGLAAVFERV